MCRRSCVKGHARLVGGYVLRARGRGNRRDRLTACARCGYSWRMTEGAHHPISRRIAQARAATGRTSHSVALELGTHPSQFSRWEHKHPPPVGTLATLAKILGVSMDWLAYGEGEGPVARTAQGGRA